MQKLECQLLFSGKSKKTVTNLLSAESANRVVTIKLAVLKFCMLGKNFQHFVIVVFLF